MANGRTAISGALSGVMVNLDGEAAIRSQSVADGSTDYDLTGPGHQGIFDTDAGAVSLVKGWVEATGSPDRVTGSVSATGQTTASAVYDDGVRDADAASRAQAVIQGNIAGDDADPAFGAISYGFAFTGSAADGGLLFYFTPVTDFAVSQSAVEADGQVQNVFNPTGLQSASGRITGGSGHGDAGFAVPAVRSVDAISDVSASSDVNTRTTNSVGVSETWTGSTQGSAMFPFDTAYVWTLSDAVTRAENPAGLAGSTGSFNAGITGTRTSGRGTYDSFVLPNTYSVSSDGSVVGSTRSTETTSGITSALTRTSAHVGSWGLHDAITDRAFVESYYFAQDQGLDGANQRGTATITGLTLTGHSASEGDSARLSLTGGLAQVNLNTLPNSATIAFPVRTAILGGTPAATLGVDQGVRTGMSTTAAPNFAYGEWAGVVDSDNPAVTVFWPI
jgi:hypothetical protein